jgi:small subunit ribosomal protein S7
MWGIFLTIQVKFEKKRIGFMSRRRRAVKREIEPDPLYNSPLLAKFINKVMYDGKKSTARRIVYNGLALFAKRAKLDDPIAGFEQALENAKPSLEVKSRRIGGATYQVPIEIPADRRTAIAMHWIIRFSREKAGRSMEEALSTELLDCLNNQGATIKKKEDTHRMAEANRAFAHYKW